MEDFDFDSFEGVESLDVVRNALEVAKQEANKVFAEVTKELNPEFTALVDKLELLFTNDSEVDTIKAKLAAIDLCCKLGSLAVVMSVGKEGDCMPIVSRLVEGILLYSHLDDDDSVGD